MFTTSTGQRFVLVDFTGTTVTVRRKLADGTLGEPQRRLLEKVNGRGCIRTDQPGVFAFTAPFHQAALSRYGKG